MSDEDILTVGETAPAPADIPAAPLPRADPVESRVAEGRHTALSQLAKSEDIEGYAQERIDQEDYFDRGEKLDERRDAAWFRRAHKALQDAALEAQGIKLNEQGEPEVPPPPPPGYVPGDEAMREVERARKEGAAAMRIQQYFGNNTERKEQITQWHQDDRRQSPDSLSTARLPRFGVTPRRASASRSRNSTCALALRSSDWARRSISAHRAESMRSRKAFLSAIVSVRAAGMRRASPLPETPDQRRHPDRQRHQEQRQQRDERLRRQARRLRRIGRDQQQVDGDDEHDHQRTQPARVCGQEAERRLAPRGAEPVVAVRDVDRVVRHARQKAHAEDDAQRDADGEDEHEHQVAAAAHPAVRGAAGAEVRCDLRRQLVGGDADHDGADDEQQDEQRTGELGHGGLERVTCTACRY